MSDLTLIQKLHQMKLTTQKHRESVLSPKERQNLGFLFMGFADFHPDTPHEVLVVNGWSNWETRKVKEFHKKLFPELYEGS